MIRSGNYNRVPFIAGSNRDEFGKALKLFSRFRRVKPEDYEKALTAEFSIAEPDARKLVELYPLAEFGNRPVEAYGRMFGADASLGCPTYLGLLSASYHQPGTYYYRFEFDRVALGKYMGSFHSLEIPFIFDSFDRMPMNIFFTRKNTPRAKELGRIIRSYWINFAKTGNPNGEGLPIWPVFRPEDQKALILGLDVRTEPAGIGKRCEFWDGYLKEHKLDIVR